MNPPDRAQAALLSYLADLGWNEVRRPEMLSRVLKVDFAAARQESPAGATVEDRLAQASGEASSCRRCRLCETRNKVVFGAGDPQARLMFIGEGPGADEDRQGLPFVGRAGDLLTRMIRAIGYEREQVYIANIVKCRPPGNRDPKPDEVDACRSYLEEQIDALRPTVIVALGRVAAQTLLGNDAPVGKLRGQWWQVRGIATRVTFHPAFLLRDESQKKLAWEDLQVVRDRVRAEPDPA